MALLIAASLKKAEALIEAILRDNPATRSDDWDLFFATWATQGVTIPDELRRRLRQCLLPETQTRCRRKIQERGLYRADPHTQAQRSIFEQGFRDTFRRTKRPVTRLIPTKLRLNATGDAYEIIE